MRYFFYSIILFVVLTTTATAQMYSLANNMKATERIKTKTLAVILKEPSQWYLDYYSKDKRRVDRYLQIVETYNKYIEEVVVARWEYSPEIKIFSPAQANALFKAKDSRYVYLELLGFSTSKNTPGTPRTPDEPAIVVSEPEHPGSVVAFEWFEGPRLTKGLLTYYIDQIIKQLHDSNQGRDKFTPAWRKEHKEYESELGKKTILLCEEWIDSELKEKVEKGDWKQKPMLSLKIVSQSELDEYLINHNKEYAFIFHNTRNYFVIDIESGKYLYFHGKYRYYGDIIDAEFIEDAAKAVNKR